MKSTTEKLEMCKSTWNVSRCPSNCLHFGILHSGMDQFRIRNFFQYSLQWRIVVTLRSSLLWNLFLMEY